LGNTGKTSDALLPEADFAGRGTVRPDLVEHLTDAAKKGKQINGGHDMNNFNATLNQAGGKVLSKVEKAPGIYDVDYQLPNSSKSFTKTIYDPAMYPNMPNMVNEAAAKGLYQYHSTGKGGNISVTVGGVKFNVVIDLRQGSPKVVTTYPIGVK
jgi:filamentous hemagglutinin